VLLLLLVMQQLVLLVLLLPLVLLPGLLKGSVIRLRICCVWQGYVPMLLVSQLMVQQSTHGLERGCGMLCGCCLHCLLVRRGQVRVGVVHWRCGRVQLQRLQLVPCGLGPRAVPWIC
jgi:hypothetical protein